MPTPSIQTLINDAQQVLNLDSISAVRSVVAVSLANANTGTPLNPNLTTQQLWNEFYQVVPRSKSDIESIIANQLMKFLYSPPAPGGVGANKQVIFNDGGVLAGAANLYWDKANNRVGIGTATPAYPLDVVGVINTNSEIYATGGRLALYRTAGASYLDHASGQDLIFRTVTSAGGAGPSELMRLNSTGLGVGAAPELKLRVDGPDAAPATSGSSATNGAFRIGAVGGSTNLCVDSGVSTTGGAYGWFQARSRSNYALNYDIVLNPNGGNVGIGVTPSAWNNNYNALDIGQNGNISGRLGTSNTVDIVSNGYRDSSGNWVYKLATSNTACRYQLDGSTGGHIWYSGAAGTAGNTIAGFSTATMTLDASGNLLVGLTADSFQPTKGIAANASNSSRISVGHANGTASGDYYHSFAYNGAVIGSITQSGTTGVAFNATSDYRLKEAVAPLTGGLARVSALKPSIYKWKADGSNGEGFLAHELAEVVPAAVSGEKDAVNEDGSIKPQGVDMSRVVPILVAAIQELTARVQTLETR